MVPGELNLSDRSACRLAYAGMVLALTVACTPAERESTPAAPASASVAHAITDPAAIVPASGDTLSAPVTPPSPSAAPAPNATTTSASVDTADAEPAPAPPTAMTAAPDLALGAAAWARTCAMCHGPAGKGTQMAKAIATKSIDVVKTKIVKGMINPGDKMPPLGAALSPEETEAVAHFVAAGFPAQ